MSQLEDPLEPVYLASSEGSEIEDGILTPGPNLIRHKCSPLKPSTRLSERRASSQKRRAPYLHGFQDSSVTHADHYDSLEDDEAFIPIKISPSIKKTLEEHGSRSQLRSLSIRVPSKQQEIHYASKPKHSNPSQSSVILAKLAHKYSTPTLKGRVPSLDSSRTEGGFSSDTSPPTPFETSSQDGDIDEDDEWDVPILLDQSAMDVLKVLAPDAMCDDLTPTGPTNASLPGDMQEIGPGIGQVIPRPHMDAQGRRREAVSIMTVPSPAGFFKSLDEDAQQVWRFSLRHVSPTTAIAEQFYDVPWRTGHDAPEVAIRQSLIPDDNDLYEDDNGDDGIELLEGTIEYDEDYQPKLLTEAQANLDRTQVWLHGQEVWLQKRVLSLAVVDDLINEGTLEDLATVVGAVSPTKSQQPERPATLDPTPTAKTPVTAFRVELPARSEPLLYHSFQRLWNHSLPSDPYNQQEARADAVQTRRLYLSAAHFASMRGHFSMKSHPRPKTELLDNLPPTPDDDVLAAKRDAIALAEKERNMLQQLEISVWHLQALGFLLGGSLLPPIAMRQVRRATSWAQKPRVLVLGEQPCASFGWAVAMENPSAKVYTAIIAPKGGVMRTDWIVHRGPMNHRVVTARSPWDLPFPDSCFDVISVRKLHMLLHHTKGTDGDRNEYEVTLAEINRVLVPGGILNFSLMDATLTASVGTSLTTISEEFSAALTTAGYDPQPVKLFLPQLRRAGFAKIKPMRLTLPLQNTSTQLGPMTGMVGSLEWEKWMLKLEDERGCAEDLLQRAGLALIEAKNAKQGNAAWSMLVGCARKAYRQEGEDSYDWTSSMGKTPQLSSPRTERTTFQ
jgi:SAM-dependent methyltransferase